MRKAFIFVDNLRVGGYQRLTLDQAYKLSDLGVDVTVFVLSPESDWNFARIESGLIMQKGIKLISVSEKRITLIGFLRKTFRIEKDKVLVISHSLRATLALRILKTLNCYEGTINTTLHQLPGLSHNSQRLKRFVYAQFSDNLFCFSKAAEMEWHNQFGSRFSKPLGVLTKKISVLRNGIYLDRLPDQSHNQPEPNRPRIIYLGRISFWKGLDTLKSLAKLPQLNHFDFLLMVPKISREDLAELSTLLHNRFEIIEGKSVSSLESRKGDVHIYPAHYGEKVSIIESISLNCLEMSAIGIPSLVSQGGLHTWPELLTSNLIREVDWSDLAAVGKALNNASKVRVSEIELKNVRQIVDIENQLLELLNNRN
jgi:glycosyltransferase involved in cell wall biosynthesis